MDKYTLDEFIDHIKKQVLDFDYFLTVLNIDDHLLFIIEDMEALNYGDEVKGFMFLDDAELNLTRLASKALAIATGENYSIHIVSHPVTIDSEREYNFVRAMLAKIFDSVIAKFKEEEDESEDK